MLEMIKKSLPALVLMPLLSGLTAQGVMAIPEASPRDVVVANAQAQQVTAKGKVVEASTGQPISMVAVRVKGTTKGVYTDNNGNFSIACKIGDTLTFTFVGFKTYSVVVRDSKSINVRLQDDAQMLSDVVVETGYQKIDRRLFTGAASQMDAKEALIDGVPDVSRMLQGKAAGVQVQNVSGTFGAAPKIRVRGASSIYGNQKPLWVVDGVVLEDVVDVSADDLSSGNATTLISSAVAGLNADDIESFQILKDASATALYGARAMNGVVVITTKKGRAGSARISYTGEFTYRGIPSYNDYNIMNSADQMDVYREMYDKGWLNYSNTLRNSNSGEFYVMSKLINTWLPAEQKFAMPNTLEAREAFLDAAARRNTDWFAELFKHSIQQNHAVSIAGGGDKAQYYGSLSFFTDPGWTLADKVTRYTGNFNINYKFSDKFGVRFLTANSVRKQRVPGTQAREFDALRGEYSRDFDINPFSFALNTSRTMRINNEDGTPFYYQRNYAPFSILNELKENYIDLDMMDSKFQIELNYNPIKELEFNAVGAVRFVKSSQRVQATEKSNKALAYRAVGDATIINSNRFLYKDPEHVNSYPQVVLPQGGFYNTLDDLMESYYFRASGNYNKTFDEAHIVNVMAGSEVKAADRSNRYSNGYGFQFYKGYVPFVDYRIIKQQLEMGNNYYGVGNDYDRFVAFFGTASYSYMGHYTFNVTGRYDGSNLLGRARSARWLPTWNVSASWNAHDVLFPEQKTISRLLFRGTYGLTASMGPARNSLPIFYNGRTFRGESQFDETYAYISSLENSELTWEKQYETNFGVDLGLFSNRISFSGDIYWRKGFDLIGNVVTSGIGGELNKLGNFANMDSHGFEFSLNTINVKTQDFEWRTNMTFSYNENKITKLDNKPRLGQLTRMGGGTRKGYPVRALFSIPFAGLNNEGVPTFDLGDGNPTYSGINMQQNENLDFLKYEGPIDPTITGGFESSFKYKGFNLSLYFTYQAGNVIRLSNDFYVAYSDINAMPREFKNRFVKAGDEKVTNIPTILSRRRYSQDGDLVYAYSAYNASDVRVAKGDFFRLKDITFSYDLPRTFIQDNLKLNNAQLRFVASNVWLMYADKKLNGLDPEFSRSGGVALPMPHQYTLSLRVGF